MKERHGSNIVYALADYRQLVVEYKTKHAHLVKTVAFWKASVIWLGMLLFSITVIVAYLLLDARKNIGKSQQDLKEFTSRMVDVSNKFERAQQELAVTQDELRKKETLVKELEKNISTNSKKQLEELLKKQENAQSGK
jgi:septal ring factor EnvC (AmiA/AmiB activator)